MYIWKQKEWPHFHWVVTRIGALLAEERYRQERLLGMDEMLGFDVQSALMLDAMVSDVVKSLEIESIALNADDVRSSVAWHLGIDNTGVPTSDRYIEGIVDVMFDDKHNSKAPLTKERLCKWHSSLLPNPSRLLHVVVGDWRQSDAPIQVESGLLWQRECSLRGSSL